AACGGRGASAKSPKTSPRCPTVDTPPMPSGCWPTGSTRLTGVDPFLRVPAEHPAWRGPLALVRVIPRPHGENKQRRWGEYCRVESAESGNDPAVVVVRDRT